jgi:hypothetical protein
VTVAGVTRLVNPAARRQPVRAGLRYVHRLPDRRAARRSLDHDHRHDRSPLGGRGIVPPTPIWTMVSVTSNETEQITLVTPN